MKFSATFISLLASLALAAAQDNIVHTVDPINPEKEQQQYELCKAASKADDGQTFAAVRYGYDGVPFSVKYGQCVPVRDANNNFVATTVFCKSATCNIYKDRACQGVATPIALDFPTADGNVPLEFPIVADFAELEGASASCTPNKVI
ncbi:hypothetical protein CVT25_012095 [Psilocybe cyanescens]|uniref:Uncharacterized protein n=1 Tax=Psilocybe cyanescens TaxID=93625 RepID=A0A409VMV3_PSICY|nr:hypothetical protein CVT25_012095 [Psilocybe cyanescens]